MAAALEQARQVAAQLGRVGRVALEQLAQRLQAQADRVRVRQPCGAQLLHEFDQHVDAVAVGIDTF